MTPRRARWDSLGSRKNRPALAAAGVLIVVVCAAAGAEIAAKADHGAPYLAIAQTVPNGTTVIAGDLAVVELDPAAGLAAVPASDEQAVIGMRASETLQAGSLLDAASLTSSSPVGKGDAVVGATLEPNQFPADMQPGDKVLVVLTSSSGSPTVSPATPASSATPTKGNGSTAATGAGAGSAGPGGAASGGTSAGVVLAQATVLDLSEPGSDTAVTAGATQSADGSSVVTLDVPATVAAVVTAASAADEISLALLPASGPQTGGGAK